MADIVQEIPAADSITEPEVCNCGCGCIRLFALDICGDPIATIQFRYEGWKEIFDGITQKAREAGLAPNA